MDRHRTIFFCRKRTLFKKSTLASATVGIICAALLIYAHIFLTHVFSEDTILSAILDIRISRSRHPGNFVTTNNMSWSHSLFGNCERQRPKLSPPRDVHSSHLADCSIFITAMWTNISFCRQIFQALVIRVFRYTDRRVKLFSSGSFIHFQDPHESLHQSFCQAPPGRTELE